VTGRKGLPRWPLALIAAPAAVAVWSGWVGLGGLCGFGVIHPLPGIIGGLSLNTAITLPVGVEAYGAYALGAWLAPRGIVPQTARTFARRSAIGALALGMAGQVIYHLLAAAHATRAPWPVVVLVSCMPVVTLGFGAALTHLLGADGEQHPRDKEMPDLSTDRDEDPSGAAFQAGLQTGSRTGPGWPHEPVPPTLPGPVPCSRPGPVPQALPGPVPDSPGEPVRPRPANRSGRKNANRSGQPVTGEDAEREFAAEIAAGQVPSLYLIRHRLHVGNDRAKVLRQHIARQALST
jgi:hypothetical protein